MGSAMFPSCSFSGLLHDATPCGLSSDYPGQVEVLALRNCTREISRHCKLYGLKADTALDTEWKLLLARAGKSYVLSYVMANSGVHFHHLFITDLDGCVILRKSSGAFHSAQNSGSFG